MTDSADLARIHLDRLTTKGTVITGKLRPGDLESLAPELASPEGELRYRIDARLDRRRRRVVSCKINGFVFLTCQRTLEAFRHEIDVDDRLVLVDSEAELPPIEEEDDGEDHVVADSPIEVRHLIEEAVILALPMVPRKPSAEPAGTVVREAADAPSPFAALASLKRTKRE